VLRAAGVDVETGVLGEEVAAGPLAAWLHAQRTGRPFVTWKYAATLDGRSAAADRTSRWITGEPARADVHRLRAEVDAVVVGIGTVLADDPQLTVRPDPGHQPLRVVLDSDGRTPAGARVRDDAAPTLVLTAADVPRHDLAAVLDVLHRRGIVSVLLEGGPVLAAAFVRAGLVDRIVGYVAPALLGAGPAALGDLGVGTIGGALRFVLEDVQRVGEDVRLTVRPEKEGR
jgi:diaminohydroxyphosphoribosylaminopyrimidine deaminase/5-amino-6-(5-phosphoribosylamino)uracil reductase